MHVALAAAAFAAACASIEPASRDERVRQVMETERAFAKTMADRDHARFTTFVSEEAVFVSGSTVSRGKREVAERWRPLFEKPAAPFSWEPDRVEVLDSGSLALSTGPVRDPRGKVVARFTSVWRQEAPGVWRIVFDRGDDCGRR